MSGPWIAAFLILGAVVLFAIVVLVGLLRRIGGVLEQAEARLAGMSGIPEVAGVGPGTVVEPFALQDKTGASISAEQFIRTPTLLLFMAPDCSSCQYLARELQGVGPAVDGLPLFVVMAAAPNGNALNLPRDVPILYDHRLEVARTFKSSATPVAFVVDQGGFVLDRTIPASVDDLRVLALRQKGGAIERHA